MLRTHPPGYDNPDSAARYLRHLSVGDCDHPALFRIAESVDKGLRHFAGIKYDALGKSVNESLRAYTGFCFDAVENGGVHAGRLRASATPAASAAPLSCPRST